MDEMHQVVMGDRGRLVIPAGLRKRAGLAKGTVLIFVETPAGLVLPDPDRSSRNWSGRISLAWI